MTIIISAEELLIELINLLNQSLNESEDGFKKIIEKESQTEEPGEILIPKRNIDEIEEL